jgi:nicotinate-nucleotide--dimethylbenzimidazole phosphoribosyltransferase
MPTEVGRSGSGGRRPDPAPGPDAAARQEALDLVARAGGELGRLAELGVWLAGVRGTGAPAPFRRARTIVVGSPDAPPRTGSARRPELDPHLADEAVEALSATLGTALRRVDVATPADPGDADALRKRAGRDSVRHAVPELTLDEFEAAYELGRFVADEEADAGTDLLVVGVDAATRDADVAAAAALCAALLAREPVAMIGTDTGAGSATGMDDRTWMYRVAATRDALRRLRRSLAEAAEAAAVGEADEPSPIEVARLVAGPRIAVLAGLLRQSVSRRTPVVLDGAVPCAAALVAARLEPDAQDWWQVAGRPAEPAAQAALAELGLVPVLDLGVRMGNGAGGLLALPVLEAAADLLAVLAGGSADPTSVDSDRTPGL